MLLHLSQAAGWVHQRAWAGLGKEEDMALGMCYGQKGLPPGTGNRHSTTATVNESRWLRTLCLHIAVVFHTAMASVYQRCRQRLQHPETPGFGVSSRCGAIAKH